VTEAAATDRTRATSPAAIATVAAYGVLGVALLATRFIGLGRSYASDELMTVRDYVGASPRKILAGEYIPNNHELFSLLGWATTSVVGDSAIALRLWSAVPFVVGVVLVTAWLHVRLGALSGLLFLFFATASPLLLDITRQARGYGLAFLGMGIVVIAALEALRSGRADWIAALCGGGLVGTLTLPHFGIAFIATSAVLLLDARLRRRTAVGLAASILAALAWYAPHLDDLAESSQQDYAAPIETGWLLTAPVDQILLPGLRWIDEVLVDPSFASLVVVAALVLLLGSSPLLRDLEPALVLAAGPVATVLALWIVQANVAPRFFSFLLVPLFVLLGTGIAEVLRRFVTTGRPRGRILVSLATLLLAAAVSVGEAERILRLPREAAREAAAAVAGLGPPSTPVVAYVPYPRDLEYYLGRPVETPRTAALAAGACDRDEVTILVTQPWLLEPARFPCTDRPGVVHRGFEQYTRGGRIDVWLLPPAA
jgi:hypothetical protein